MVTAMLQNSPEASEVLRSLSGCLVEDLDDGGVRSLRFRTSDSRKARFGKNIAEAQFTLKTVLSSARS